MDTERSQKSPRISSNCRRPRKLTLNDLPQNAIDEILTHIPIETAISTSLISRFWRQRWKSIPNLVFYNRGDLVTRALLLHSAPLQTFEFIGPHSPSVYCWLYALASRSANTLHTLILDFHQHISKYHLHSTAFSFLHLTCLSLCKCTLGPPPEFAGFKQLQSLQLEEVSFPDGSQLSSLISASPYLRSVTLLEVQGRGCLKICGPSISHLDIVDVGFDDFALGSCPLLDHADIRLTMIDSGESYDGGDYDDGEQWLALGQHSSKILVMYGIPKRTLFNFDHLLILSLGIDFTDIRSVLATICLLRSCSNLEKLEIKSCFLNEYDPEAAEDIWDKQAQLDLFPKLQTVEMCGIMFKESELELVRVILETAQVLQTMVIHARKARKASARATGLAIIKLLEFPRASNQARILCRGYIT